jgi:hypothetical protein
MQLFARKRLAIAEEGEWVTGAEIAALASGAIRVRGIRSEKASDVFHLKARSASKAEKAKDGSILPSVLAAHTREVLSEVCILDARDLPFSADELRAMVLDASYENLIVACIAACQHVDRLASESDVDAIRGNLPISSSGKHSTDETPPATEKP